MIIQRASSQHQFLHSLYKGRGIQQQPQLTAKARAKCWVWSLCRSRMLTPHTKRAMRVLSAMMQRLRLRIRHCPHSTVAQCKVAMQQRLVAV